jgi:GWxTD domain-containing protein
MTLVAGILITVCGFQLGWSIIPAGDDALGSVRVSAVLEEEDFIFVRENGTETASYEVVASLDQGGFTRSGGSIERSDLPAEVTLDLGGVEAGVHQLLVVARDLESGRRRTREGTIEVPMLQADLWSAGGIQVVTGPSGRAAGLITASWQVYPPTESGISSDTLDVAWVLRGESGLVLGEGWMQSEGDGLFTTTVDLDGIEAGTYSLLGAALNAGEVAVAAGTSLEVRPDWDVWGRDEDETRALVRPIALNDEIDALGDAGSESERRAVMSEFWQQRDPTPYTSENEYLDVYLARLDVVMERFSVFGIKGISTDMGRVYALLGEPDIIEDMPFETEMRPYQVWTYFSPSLTVVFIDDDGFGLYELSTPWSEVRRVYER